MELERPVRRSARHLSAPPLVWSGVVVTVLACAAVTVALQLAAGAERTRETAESFRRRLQLLRIERDLVFAADRMEALALLNLMTGSHGDELLRAQSEFTRQLPRTQRSLERFLARSPRGREAAEPMLEAVSSFAGASQQPDTPAASLRAVSELYTALGWILLGSPDGKWFDLCDYVHDLQIATSYAFDTADEYLARYWEIARPPTAPDIAAQIESVTAYLRALDQQPRDPKSSRWMLDPLLDLGRARELDPALADLAAELRARPGAQVIRDVAPFLLYRTSQPPLPPGELYDHMEELSYQLLDGAQQALELADGRIADEARREHRRSVAARALAVVCTLVAVGVLVALELHRRRFNRHLRQLAETDALTGLGNRYTLEAVERHRLVDPAQAGFALIHLDLDNFKAVNDSFGHHVGDLALVAFARTCRGALRADDSIARVGGDEFVIVLHRLADPERGAREVAHRIHESLREPLDCGGRGLRIQVSTGIATSEGPAELAEMMIEADLALYAAKERGRNRHEVFADAVRRRLVRDLPHALANGGIGCVFQPQVDLMTGEVLGIEALARWPEEDGGAVPARKMIDAIEWLGQTLRLLRCVLARVEAAYAGTSGVYHGRFWLNLSPVDLSAADCADVLLEIFDAASLPRERLGVEITESLPILDFVHAHAVLGRLRRAGIAVAIDDFGSQNTPLKHLTRLPVDVVKLDRTVVAQIDTDRSNRVLASAVLSICRAHGMAVLAEGVETAREVEALRELGLQRAQGFAICRPLSLGDLAGFLTGSGLRPGSDPATGRPAEIH